jgi:hypothetical protein
MDRFDVLLLLGIGLVALGFGLIYFPLGLLAGGAGCIAIAVIGARGETAAPEHTNTHQTAPHKDNA